MQLSDRIVQTDRKFIKSTKSRCVVCGVHCPAEVVETGNSVFMNRTCPVHGAASYRIGHKDYYWSFSDCAGGTCCTSSGSKVAMLGSNALAPSDSMDEHASCTVLVDIVTSCNYPCPTCYSASPHGIGANLEYTPYETVVANIEKLIARSGEIDMLQLSGGEPTLHPDFFEIATFVRDHPKIRFLLVNTNGSMFSNDSFVEKFREIIRPNSMAVYLQFDGLQEAGQLALRGGDFRKAREIAIARCAEIGLGVHLVMTVTHDNLPYVWETLEWGASKPGILGVSFQPKFMSGRADGNLHDNPIVTGDIICALIEQSQDAAIPFVAEDFSPLPCGNPQCHCISGFYREEGMLIPVVRNMSKEQIAAGMKDTIRLRLENVHKCLCDGSPFVNLLKDKVLKSANGFLVLIKPFMDARTYDEDRIKQCCTKVLLDDGKVDSFCRHYFGGGNKKSTTMVSVKGKPVLSS